MAIAFVAIVNFHWDMLLAYGEGKGNMPNCSTAVGTEGC